jgi:DNA-binding MarR family transcriptional regulator
MARFTPDNWNCTAHRAPGRMMRRIDKLMSTAIEARFDPGEISFQQWIALKVIDDGVVTCAGELARELGHTTGATTRMIDTLETRGLLTRDRGSADRRVVKLILTRAGEDKVKELVIHAVALWNEVLVDFDQDEVEDLIERLISMLAAVERATGPEKEWTE